MDGRTEDAKTISLRLCRGIITKLCPFLGIFPHSDSRLLNKTTFGEPLGIPVIKPTEQILNQPDGTGFYPGKPQKDFFYQQMTKVPASKERVEL